MAFIKKFISSLIILMVSLVFSGRGLAETPALATSGINVELAGPAETLGQGSVAEVRVKLTAVSDATLMAALDLIFSWNPQELEFIGISQQGAVPLLSSYLPSQEADYTGINESSIPSDGTALYYALAPLGKPILVGSTPILLVTLRFRVLEDFIYSPVIVLPSLEVTYPADTAVYSGSIEGAIVTGNLISGVVLGESILTQTTLPSSDSQAAPPSQEQRVTLNQVFGCATVRSINREDGPSGGAASAIGFLLPFLLMTIIWRGSRGLTPAAAIR